MGGLGNFGSCAVNCIQRFSIGFSSASFKLLQNTTIKKKSIIILTYWLLVVVRT